ncbi:membrane protein insertase YidC [Neorickettsia findlayensis]|uniref:Membrane protein insertase YidC n=1 Tax=Neorickettsia findlayensis TaxID=2686014 RepID=A0A6P1GB74_9RICK|nr:membrane protein insertase YidC [Neorickettsia findlayensis]QHD65151.1 membrane protein insertase YidC [Neorickettsia findlayensis]
MSSVFVLLSLLEHHSSTSLMQQTYNVFIATLLSFLVIIGWNLVFYNPTQRESLHEVQERESVKVYESLESTLNTERIRISSNKLEGSIQLTGLALDDLVLKDYESDDLKNQYRLLYPNKTKGTYFVNPGWTIPGDSGLKIPSSKTKWKADSEILTPNNPVTFSWDNESGLLFKVVMSLDDNYMFTFKQIVENKSQNDLSVGSHFTITKRLPETNKSMLIMHEGPVGVIKDRLIELKYSKITKKNKSIALDEETQNRRGWFGFSDKYWFVSQIFENSSDGKVYVSHVEDKSDDIFRITNFDTQKIVRGGGSITKETMLFAGPKKLSLLEQYAQNMRIYLFDRAVDFGVLYFITKPISKLLQIFYQLVGNFGVAIILLTLFIRVLMLPLSIKSGISMFKIKELQPEILKIKSIYQNDKDALNKASVELFRKHRVTPMSGCLPTLLQVPVFFALYKVIFITIEMRQAPFFLWITDLSLPDPTNLFTLFGLINWNCPDLLSIGILPIILGLTMVIQQKLSPSHYEDGTQAFMIKAMPYVFMILFASFPSGLVLYWVFNNILSLIQQFMIGRYLITKKLNAVAETRESIP